MGHERRHDESIVRYTYGSPDVFRLEHALLYGPLLSLGTQKFGNLLMRPSQADLLLLKGLIETGKVKPVIDRRYALREVPEAIRYVEQGHARGKVVVTVATA